MIALRGRTRPLGWHSFPARHVWSLSTSPRPARPADAFLVEGDRRPPEGFALYVVKESTQHGGALAVGRSVVLPADLNHLRDGDIIALSSAGDDLAVLWRRSASHNSILLTEQCDNYCLMCSQPPKVRDDSWLFDRAEEVISLLPPDTVGFTFTGGEPTLHAERFLALLRSTTRAVPDAEIHILSNGRRFADWVFTEEYAAIGNPRLMVGIPIYGTEPDLHDFVVQSRGAFEETIRGILNLAASEQRVEVRVVLHRYTAPVIVDIAEYIARNLPFVEQVALMGLEITGLARVNLHELWIDPFDYRTDLTEAALLLDSAGLRTLIYNHQLCLLEPPAWTFAVRSISDWKNEYDPACDQCQVRSACGGFFHSAQHRSSRHVHPLDKHGIPLAGPAPAEVVGGWRRGT